MLRKVVEKLGKSPMNKRVNLVLLDCGHDLFSGARLRVGSAINCDKCDTEAARVKASAEP